MDQCLAVSPYCSKFRTMKAEALAMQGRLDESLSLTKYVHFKVFCFSSQHLVIFYVKVATMLMLFMSRHYVFIIK